jgi:hypothetical protein
MIGRFDEQVEIKIETNELYMSISGTNNDITPITTLSKQEYTKKPMN